MSGNNNNKLLLNVAIKKDYVRKSDGASAIYIRVSLSSERKKIPLNIFVPVKYFDTKKQRVKTGHPHSRDYNLIIEKGLADINKIEISYRLSGNPFTLELLLEEYFNPSAKVDFIKFWELQMETQKLVLKDSTYRNQLATLRKIKRYKSSIFFHEIDLIFVQKMILFFKKEKKNEKNTISTLTKNLKKYLGIANKAGIHTPLHFTDVPHQRMTGTISYLTGEEINKIYQYYSSDFIKESHKIVAAKFLFSCFTGLRLGDVIEIDPKLFVDSTLLIFKASKTDKVQRIKLNKTAKHLVDDGYLFGCFAAPTIRKYLNEICNTVGINKRVNYHMSRHSFATNFLLQGGRIEVLQKLLGHSDIKETMIYVHVIEDVTNEQIMFLDNVIKPAK